MSNSTDYLFVSHEISRDLYQRITEILKSKKSSSENCVLFLTTYGGDPDAGFRIGRCLHHHYKHLKIVVPSYCKSAGTLIAIAAHELSIGNTGELGPLDIQVKNPNEMQGRNSGLDIQQALSAIDQHATKVFLKFLTTLKNQAGLSTRLAGELAIKLAVGQTEPLYAQIDPLRIGELQRAMSIAKFYGERLNAVSKNLRDGALDMLTFGYPAHSHVIDRKEACSLFVNLSKPTAVECGMYEKMLNHLHMQQSFIEFQECNDNEQASSSAADDSRKNGRRAKVGPKNAVRTSKKKPRNS